MLAVSDDGIRVVKFNVLFRTDAYWLWDRSERFDHVEFVDAKDECNWKSSDELVSECHGVESHDDCVEAEERDCCNGCGYIGNWVDQRQGCWDGKSAVVSDRRRGSKSSRAVT